MSSLHPRTRHRRRPSTFRTLAPRQMRGCTTQVGGATRCEHARLEITIAQILMSPSQDVAAIGFNVPIISNGTADPTLVDGTSCSSPIFASVIALLNDELIAAGRPPLGFLNPWLYSNATTAFNDITTGSNPGCNTVSFVQHPTLLRLTSCMNT